VAVACEGRAAGADRYAGSAQGWVDLGPQGRKSRLRASARSARYDRFGNNMHRRMPLRSTVLAAVASLAALVCSGEINAQAPPAGGPRPVQTPQAAASVDLTGDWVSVVTGDWKFRMVTPNKGVFDGLPLNAEGRRIGNDWDPKKDAA